MDSYRSILEVLKFLPPRDILTSAENTCRKWLAPAESEELWWSLSNDLESLSVPDYNISGKQFFKENFGDKFLPFVLGSSIWLISLRKLSLKQIRLDRTTGVTQANVYCFISTTDLLCFGACTSPTVLEINIKTRKLTRRPPMSTGRQYPGVLKYRDWVYLFAGKCRTSEKYSLKTRSWHAITDQLQTPMEGINPCEHTGEVYLVSHNYVETFNIEKERFSIVPVTLKIDWWYAFSTVYKDELFIMQAGYVSRWSLSSNLIHLNEEKRYPALGIGYWSNCPPVWFLDRFYSLENTVPRVTGVLSFTPKSAKLTQVLVFPRLTSKP